MIYSKKLLTKAYQIKRKDIDLRLNYFKSIYTEETDNFIFKELCFCLLTPQSKARTCDKAIEALYVSEVLFTGFETDIVDYIKNVRFKNNKAKYIVLARNLFFDVNTKQILIKNKMDSFDSDVNALRMWFVKNIKGVGMKEASHFLRNIGKGQDIAILDRHILTNLKRYQVISEIPKNLTIKKYIEIENKIKEFSKYIKIPMDALDLLFWSNETGEIFK